MFTVFPTLIRSLNTNPVCLKSPWKIRQKYICSHMNLVESISPYPSCYYWNSTQRINEALIESLPYKDHKRTTAQKEECLSFFLLSPLYSLQLFFICDSILYSQEKSLCHTSHLYDYYLEHFCSSYKNGCRLTRNVCLNQWRKRMKTGPRPMDCNFSLWFLGIRT